MKLTLQWLTLIRAKTLLAAILISAPLLVISQPVSVYQFRRVPDDKVQEFIYRETNYWSKVAQKAVDNKKMTFWALLQKVGGYDLPNSSNFLFINTFPDIDAVMNGEVFDAAPVFPNIPLASMETNSMSTTTSMFYLSPGGFQQATRAKPDQDFNYVIFNYHNTNYPDSFVNLENQYWAPFIKAAMDKKQTNQMGWGNSTIILPRGEDIKYTCLSYDLYPSLQKALRPGWPSDLQFPTEGLNKLTAITAGRTGLAIYRIVKVVSSN